MKKYELNGLGRDWVYPAGNEEQATAIYIMEVCLAKNLEEYENYCKEVCVNPVLDWKEWKGVDE